MCTGTTSSLRISKQFAKLSISLSSIFIGAAPKDTISQYFDSRQRRSDGGSASKGLFTRALRRTLPFQLVPQPPLAYARSNSYVGEPEAIEVDTNLASSAAATEDNFEGK